MFGKINVFRGPNKYYVAFNRVEDRKREVDSLDEWVVFYKSVSREVQTENLWGDYIFN